jgi:AraC family transcriptional regulator
VAINYQDPCKVQSSAAALHDDSATLRVDFAQSVCDSKPEFAEARHLIDAMDPKLRGSSFHGSVLKVLHSGEMRVTEVAYRPHLKNPQHSHEYAYIGITLEGGSTQLCKNRIRSAKPWTVMFHPAGEVHSDNFRECGARELNIEITPANLKRLCERFSDSDRAVEMNGGKAGWLAARLYGEFRLMDQLSWMSVEGLTMELMAEILRHDVSLFRAKAPPWLRQVEELIHDRYTERLTLSELARVVSVHPVHLAREFRRRVGCTIGQQIRQLRIERACRLLSESNQSLVEVALATGFPEQSQFTKTFRNSVGLTPSEYRRLNPPAKFRQNC